MCQETYQEGQIKTYENTKQNIPHTIRAIKCRKPGQFYSIYLQSRSCQAQHLKLSRLYTKAKIHNIYTYTHTHS